MSNTSLLSDLPSASPLFSSMIFPNGCPDLTRVPLNVPTRPCADRGLITSLETNRATKAIETEASALVELAAECLDATPGLSPAGLHGPCEMCEAGALKCHRFSPTPHRPELCACIHGAPYHACVDPREARSKPGAPRSGLPGAPQPAGPSTPEPTSSRRDFVLAELLRRCATFLSSAGSEGIRDLLGLRRTAGSLESSLPPPRRTLLEALNRPHATPAVGPVAAAAHPAPSSPAREGAVAAAEEGASSAHKRRARRKRATIVCNLTVGGRALCKHAVRGEEGWWGGSGGTEADKNGRAERAALRVLAGATWVNLHVFGGGGGDGVFEVREASGYGARWSTDGAVFRGFLEPHMEDGHEKGWRH